jgi:Ca-activated chloride channel homolog
MFLRCWELLRRTYGGIIAGLILVIGADCPWQLSRVSTYFQISMGTTTTAIAATKSGVTKKIRTVTSQHSAAQTDDTTIKIDTNLVVLNVTVTDSQGRRITQLKASDFRLEDEGKNCVISHFVAEEAPFAVVILIDASESMQAKLARAKVAAAHFADLMRADDVISVVSFHDKVEQIQDFSSSRDLDIQDIEAQGRTKLYDGLLQGINLLAKRNEQRRAVVLISDGADTGSNANNQEILKRALEVGATVYAVDIADERVARAENLQNSGVLKNLADKTGGRYLRTPGGLLLQSELQQVAEELRSQYTLGFYPDKTATGRSAKLQRLKLSLANSRPAVIRTRQGYYPPAN